MEYQKGILSKRNATVKVILFTSKTLANGEHPIMLKITKNRIRKHISIGLSSALKYWDKAKELPKASHPKRVEITAIINNFERKILDRIQEFNLLQKDYTIEQLLESVLKPSKSTKVSDFIEDLISTLKEEKRMGTAKVQKDCLQMLLKFSPNKNLTFQEIDYNFLTKWESYMRKNDFKETSMAVYFRTLRSIYNKAIKEEIVTKNFYPFDDFKISKFDTKTKKRAITKEEMLRIIYYPTSKETKMHDCKNIFVFSYLNQGINFIDIAHLKWSNILSNKILEYTRRKTGHDFQIPLSDLSLAIISEYTFHNCHKSNEYIFPILDLEKHKTPQQIENRLRKVLRQVNSNMKIIGKELDIEIPISTYVARHTYATVLKRSGISTSIISNALGHESESITQTYLDEFDQDVFIEANKHLV